MIIPRKQTWRNWMGFTFLSPPRLFCERRNNNRGSYSSLAGSIFGTKPGKRTMSWFRIQKRKEVFCHFWFWVASLLHWHKSSNEWDLRNVRQKVGSFRVTVINRRRFGEISEGIFAIALKKKGSDRSLAVLPEIGGVNCRFLIPSITDKSQNYRLFFPH